ncbi:DUF2085 domain-containing protein [Patescibacteria group bacterium]|nr:DUF2085 domain-containing protein [Patescibacteria group bacterium]MBU1970171.1 DUF2085 domain-containing protein [Patescibacteria group bacterium]
MKNTLIEYVSFIGKIPLCNKKRERAPNFGSFCFPLCWRCIGLVSGAILGTIIYRIYNIELTTPIRLMLFLPLLVDSTMQKTSHHQSNNPVRLITGILFPLAFI